VRDCCDIEIGMSKLHQQALERHPGGIAIELTTNCNLTCKMCNEWKRRKHDIAHDKVLSLLDEARALGATGFNTCGTEPFMRDDTPAILAYAERIGFEEICVVSNGILLHEGQILETLGKLRNLNIVISLDGPKDVHDELRGSGVYEKAVEALHELRNRGITCSISSVIMRQTLNRLTEIVDLAADLSIPVISMQPYQRETAGLDSDHGRFEFQTEDEESINKKLSQLMIYAEQKNVILYTAGIMKYVPPYLAQGIIHIPPGGCNVPSRLLIVDSSGECYPCFQIRNRMKHKSMGNVFQSPLIDIWHNNIHQELNMMALNSKCPRCLAACSDMDSYNSMNPKHFLTAMISRLMKPFMDRL